MTCQQELLARKILAHHSKSFALAGGLLPAWCRQDATALYAWCRRCDDAVDIPREEFSRRAAVRQLREELDQVYSRTPSTDPVLAGFQAVVRRQMIPRRYAEDLIEGMAMDIGVVRYKTFDDLLLYCYRVAGTVGLMMAHIMKIREPEALRRATDLGIAMQLTNICRDVAEDRRRGRVYLPEDLLKGADGSSSEVSRPEGWSAAKPHEVESAGAVAELLRRADQFYESGDLGMSRLPLRCAIAIRAARLIYSEIGREIARRRFDVTAGRAVVSRGRKFWLAVRAVVGTIPVFIVGKLLARRKHPGRRPEPLPFVLPIGDAPETAMSLRRAGTWLSAGHPP